MSADQQTQEAGQGPTPSEILAKAYSNFKDGYVEYQFKYSNKTFDSKTYYKYFGDITDSKKTPLILLHGGPGGGHECMLSLSEIVPETGPIIFYDQIGCGKSTTWKEFGEDTKFWTSKLFLDELTNLLDSLGLKDRQVDILGHSSGGIFALEWVANTPQRVRKFIIASTPASVKDMQAGLAKLKPGLDKKVLETIEECERTGNFASPEYQWATIEFFQKHMSILKPFPALEVAAGLGCLTSNMHSYIMMWGHSEFTITGSLKDWTGMKFVDKITMPTLLINGDQDEVTKGSMQPLADNIQNVYGGEVISVKDAAHFGWVDGKEEFQKHVKEFLLA